jgi:hypothetical protein
MELSSETGIVKKAWLKEDGRLQVSVLISIPNPNARKAYDGEMGSVTLPRVRISCYVSFLFSSLSQARGKARSRTTVIMTTPIYQMSSLVWSLRG